MKKILIIEDEESISSVLKLVFINLGYRVSQAVNIQAGINKLARHDFSVVITQSLQSSAEQADVMAAIHKKKSPPKIIRILEENHKVLGDESYEMVGNCCSILQKPFSREDVIKVLDES